MEPVPRSRTAPLLFKSIVVYNFAVTILKLVSLPGFEPGPHGPKPCTQPDNALER
jgi:hypothetical protein